MKRARIGKTVWTREDELSEWKSKTFDSVSQAKAENGLNSVTLESANQLPAPKEKS